MANIRHTKVSAAPAASDPALIDGPAWNDAHTVTLVDGDIPASIARDSEVTAAVAAEATLARNADNLASGTVADARIASTIARDSEVTSAVGAEATARDAAIEVHRADTTNVHGITDTANVVLTGDARLSDARTPTGAAGGDLGGTFPNPTVSDDSHSHTSATLPAAGADLSGVDFLVGTASGLLSAEIPVGTTPGGELGGTWASPTVAATHSGSTHAATQAAAEATAAGALSSHAGAADPHPGYVTSAEGAASYDAIGAAAAAQAASQPLDSDLTAIAAIAPSDDDFIQRKSGVWVKRTIAQVKTDLGVGDLSGDVSSSGLVTTIGSGKVTEAMQVLADNTTQNVSTSKHGYAPKGDGTTTKFLNANGAYSTPAGGATIAYPSLKPATPTDDFNSTLSGWTAVQTGGTFTITPCIAQTLDGSHLFMPFYANTGFIYRSTTNIDQEWIAGGLIAPTRGGDNFYGIAVLDSSNNGVGLIYHTSDDTAAIISITAGVFDSAQAQTTPTAWGGRIGSPTKLWFRLTRVTNTWDAFVSLDGVNWNESSNTISKTITASRVAIGVFKSASNLYGVLYADWVHLV